MQEGKCLTFLFRFVSIDLRFARMSIADSDGVLCGLASDSSRAMFEKPEFVPMSVVVIFRRGTLRRMGSVLPGLPRRLYGNDLIGMSIGVAVGCGRRPPMGRHGSGVPLHERLIPRLAENWRSLRRVSYMELVGSVAAERPKLP